MEVADTDMEVATTAATVATVNRTIGSRQPAERFRMMARRG